MSIDATLHRMQVQVAKVNAIELLHCFGKVALTTFCEPKMSGMQQSLCVVVQQVQPVHFPDAHALVAHTGSFPSTHS